MTDDPGPERQHQRPSTTSPTPPKRPPGRFDMRGGEGGTSAGAYAGLGLQFAASIIFFLYVGQWLDRRLGTEPWLLLLFVFGGAGASFYSIYRKLMAAQEREEQARRAARDAERTERRP